MHRIQQGGIGMAGRVSVTLTANLELDAGLDRYPEGTTMHDVLSVTGQLVAEDPASFVMDKGVTLEIVVKEV